MTTKTKILLPIAIVTGIMTFCLIIYTLFQLFNSSSADPGKYGTYNVNEIYNADEWSDGMIVSHEDYFSIIGDTANMGSDVYSANSTNDSAGYENSYGDNYGDNYSDSYGDSHTNDTTYSNGINGNYILSGSDSRYITMTEALSLSASMQRIARNEIYARHGRMFNDAELQAYFNSQPWYTPIYTAEQFDAIGNSLFNNYEIKNLELLSSL